MNPLHTTLGRIILWQNNFLSALNEISPLQADGFSVYCRVGTVDEGDLPAVRLEGIVPQPFQPYKLYATNSGVSEPTLLNKKSFCHKIILPILPKEQS